MIFVGVNLYKIKEIARWSNYMIYMVLQ